MRGSGGLAGGGGEIALRRRRLRLSHALTRGGSRCRGGIGVGRWRSRARHLQRGGLGGRRALNVEGGFALSRRGPDLAGPTLRCGGRWSRRGWGARRHVGLRTRGGLREGYWWPIHLRLRRGEMARRTTAVRVVSAAEDQGVGRDGPGESARGSVILRLTGTVGTTEDDRFSAASSRVGGAPRGSDGGSWCRGRNRSRGWCDLRTTARRRLG